MTASTRVSGLPAAGSTAILVVTVLFWLCYSVVSPAAAQQMRPVQGRGYSYGPNSSQPYRLAQHVEQPMAHPQQAEPTLKAYPCRPGEAVEMAARLQAEFGRYAAVRIVADQRTSQILVMAPPSLHTQISSRVNVFPVATAGSPPSQDVRSRELQFQHLTGGQIETALVATLDKRFTAVASPAPGIKNYRLALPNGGMIDLGIHLRDNLATVRGIGTAVDSCIRLLQTLDSPQPTGNQRTRTVSLQAADQASVQRAVSALRGGGTAGLTVGMLLPQQFQQPTAATPPTQPAVPPGPVNGVAVPPAGQPAEGVQRSRGLVGPVQIEWLEGLDVLVLRGREEDVAQVMEIINEIERLSVETVPAVEVYRLRHVDCQALAALIGPLYEEVFQPRQGTVSITPLVKPNSLLLVGRTESVQTVADLIKRLDFPVAPDAQFRVFRLRHAAAGTTQETITEFFGEPETAEDQIGLAPRVLATADFRSNSLIVRASPRDMAEVAALIERIDTSSSEAVNELRLFKLQNSLAEELEPILQSAIVGEDTGRGLGAGAGAGGVSEQKSSMLKFVTVDTKGQRRLRSGILTDVRITAEPRANTLLVSAPAESMELIGALIHQLDQLPAAEAQIKVFTIVNSDASGLMEMLETLFGQQQQGTTSLPAVRTGAVEGESSLVQLRFAVDVRTNSIIASGSMGDLQVVEAILLRLDESDVRQRKSAVYRLKNAPAQDVAAAINEFLRSERQVQQIEPGLLSAFEQIEREVIVVPEVVSNSLIVSATPRFFDEIEQLVDQLDARPPMVMIQVLIAEVALNNTDEFGVELGLQDSILFDRSLLGDLVTISKTTQTASGQVANQEIVGASNTPGFAFNNLPLGNSGATSALASATTVGSQGISHFSVGRTNDELGFGGLVLSASSESVNILVRALKECRRLEVLSRPQIMTLDNQPAFIQVGERVPRITSAQINEAGQVNQVTLTDVGLILGVTPRISPDGLVVMEIDAEKSELGSEAEGIPVTVSATGEVVRSPRIKITLAQTTVSASSGQTVVLGGLITKSKIDVHRKVPWVGDIPVLGHLFRYDGVSTKKAELLIIMTPHIVSNEEDAEAIKQTEMARMSWCLGDVLELQGDDGFRGRTDEWSDAETTVIYPDLDPSGEITTTPEDVPNAGQPTPAPNGNPFWQEPIPAPDASAPSLPGGQGPTPATQPGTGTVPGEPQLIPGGMGQQLHWGSQSPYGPPRYFGGVEQAVYQRQGQAPVTPGRVGPATAFPPSYNGHRQWQQPPAGRPVEYRQPPAVQPVQYRQPLAAGPAENRQTPMVRLPQPYAPIYR